MGGGGRGGGGTGGGGGEGRGEEVGGGGGDAFRNVAVASSAAGADARDNRATARTLSLPPDVPAAAQGQAGMNCSGGDWPCPSFPNVLRDRTRGYTSSSRYCAGSTSMIMSPRRSRSAPWTTSRSARSGPRERSSGSSSISCGPITLS